MPKVIGPFKSKSMLLKPAAQLLVLASYQHFLLLV
jgi:hypothetical protein